MKKIVLITIVIAFLIGCSGPPDQQSQKESTKQPVKAAKQYDPWPKHQKSTAKPLSFEDLDKSPEELRKQAAQARKEIQEDLKKARE
jgi:PBP1b-binding outer membrane lipoprotein LpoB